MKYAVYHMVNKAIIDKKALESEGYICMGPHQVTRTAPDGSLELVFMLVAAKPEEWNSPTGMWQEAE